MECQLGGIKMRFNKKAVSGLIVAVLLLAVALTIGGLVMGWISGYTSDNLDTSSSMQKQQDDCFKRDFKVISVNATGPQGANGWAKIIIENKNDQPIKGFLLKFVASDASLYAFEYKNSSAALGAYVRNTYEVANNSANTAGLMSFAKGFATSYNITKVEISPIIDIVVDTTEEKVCESKTKTIESSNFVNTQ